ncbi:MAG: ATP-dependent helicase [Actinobacteria bacterium]|nr:ATP-dependent helicase [Actinomycetota bacterium]
MDFVGGPKLTVISGGPGTGKTTLIASMIAEIINSTSSPVNILAITFSRRLAKDLWVKVLSRCQRSFEGLSVGTFYSFCSDFINNNYRSMDCVSPPKLMTALEHWRFVSNLIRGLDEKKYPSTRDFFQNRSFIQEVFDFVLRAQDFLYSPHDYELVHETCKDDALQEMFSIYKEYIEMRGRYNLQDFSGIVLAVANFLDKVEESHISVNDVPEYVFVDEFQEASPSQRLLFKKLLNLCRGACVAFDEGSRIFGFRGASREGLDEIIDGCRDVGVNYLTDSRRVSEEIVSRTTKLVDCIYSVDRLKMKKGRDGRGGMKLFRFDSELTEYEFIARYIRDEHDRGDLCYRNIAIVLRTANQDIEMLTSILDENGVPYKFSLPAKPLSGEISFNLLNFFKFLIDLSNGDVSHEALVDLLLSRLFRIDPFFVKRFEKLVESQRKSGGRRVDIESLYRLSGANRHLRRFKSAIYRFKDRLSDKPAAVIFDALFYFNLIGPFILKKSPAFERISDYSDLEDIRELCFVASRFSDENPNAGITDFISFIEDSKGFIEDPEISDLGEEIDAVSVITGHRIKGREFDLIFIPKFIENVFPARDYGSMFDVFSWDKISGVPRMDSLKDEISLLYYILGRQRRGAVISLSDRYLGQEDVRPSRFIGMLDLSPECVLQTCFVKEDKKEDRHILPSFFAGDEVTENSVNPFCDGEFKTSFTALSSYEDCPLKYKYEHFLNIRMPRTIALARGKLYHEIIQDFILKGDMTLRSLFDSIDNIWDESLFEFLIISKEQKRECLSRFEAFHGWFMERGVMPVEVEKKFEFEMDRIRFSGKTDMIGRFEDGFEIVDFKSSQTALSFEDAACDLQLGSYLLATDLSQQLSDYRGRIKRMSYIYIGEMREPERPGSCEPQRVLEVKEQIKNIISKIFMERFEPNPRNKSVCHTCDFKIVCPKHHGSELLQE